MMFSERAEIHKKEKERKSDLKQLRKDMLSAGIAKAETDLWMKEIKQCLELGSILHREYQAASTHLAMAREAIGTILDCMNESPVEEVKKSFALLISDLDLVYHDCSIRKDDLDFAATINCLKKMTAEFDGKNTVMLRSELENLKAVLDDAYTFRAPDFLALAYYYQHEDREKLADMDNEQRNTCVMEYYRAHFMNEFEKALEQNGLKEALDILVEKAFS